MPLFDAYVMVDWSGGDRRRSGMQDCLWIAHGAATDAKPHTLSPPSRTEAEHILRSILQAVVAAGRRVLVGIDIAYGYPAGFAALLPSTRHAKAPPWRRTWQYLARHLQDDLGTAPGHRPTNRSNRFEVASAINAAVGGAGPGGPFWCLFRPGSHACIPQTQPAQPFAHANGTLAPGRLTDTRARSGTPFRLFGTGSVGSQALTGIPHLERLRADPRFSRCSAVWPFETGWAPATGAWLDPGLQILHAEIYPSVRPPLPDAIKDRGQIRATWHWARDLDAVDRLIAEFAIPAGIVRGSRVDRVIRREEGWILGCSR